MLDRSSRHADRWTVGPPPQHADSPEVAALYADHCALCHGTDGRGAGGPGLLNKDDAQLIETQIAGGVGSMPGFGDRLSEPEITALAVFVAALE